MLIAYAQVSTADENPDNTLLAEVSVLGHQRSWLNANAQRSINPET